MNEEYYRICLRPLSGCLRYRGLQRLGPVPRESEPLDSAFNSACLEYLNQGDRLVIYKEAYDLFRRICESTQDYELISFKLFTEPFIAQECLLGFDICQNFWNSLLSWDWSENPTWQSTESNLVIVRVVFDLFESQLNSNRLFSDYTAAEKFIKAVNALRIICPGTWESPGHEDYEIVAICEGEERKGA